jgi:hypothetical protein
VAGQVVGNDISRSHPSESCRGWLRGGDGRRRSLRLYRVICAAGGIGNRAERIFLRSSRRSEGQRSSRDRLPPAIVLDVGRRDDHREDPPGRIDEPMPLRAGDPLTTVRALPPPHSRVSLEATSGRSTPVSSDRSAKRQWQRRELGTPVVHLLFSKNPEQPVTSHGRGAKKPIGTVGQRGGGPPRGAPGRDRRRDHPSRAARPVN